MIDISKGDIVAEPLEFLIGILIRIFGKAAAKSFPNEPIENWEMSQVLLLWLFVFLGILALAILVHYQQKKTKTKL